MAVAPREDTGSGQVPTARDRSRGSAGARDSLQGENTAAHKEAGLSSAYRR